MELDWAAIHGALSARRVLVTGGGGSIGSELCRQVALLGAQSLTVVEHSEYNLYRIMQELRADFPELIVDGMLASCGDLVAMRRVFAQVMPQVVFHAAAYKHVPLLQAQVRAAFNNNVLGTRTVADVASAMGVECFVMISTDKAVNPTSVMGACKRVAEIYCQNLNAHSSTRFVTVRFGNVLNSAGSVVPLFRRQIRRGRSGDRHASGNDALFHADSRGLPVDPAGCDAGQGRRNLCAGHGASRLKSATWPSR